MKKIKEFCSDSQMKRLIQIGNIINGFSIENGNTVTHALTGLITELTSMDYNSPSYLHEKLAVLIAELQE
jgi:hypothetical protein